MAVPWFFFHPWAPEKMHLATPSKERCRDGQFSCHEPCQDIAHTACGCYSSTSLKVQSCSRVSTKYFLTNIVHLFHNLKAHAHVIVLGFQWVTFLYRSPVFTQRNSTPVLVGTTRLNDQLCHSLSQAFAVLMTNYKVWKEKSDAQWFTFQSWTTVFLLLPDRSLLLHDSSTKECHLYFH